MLKINFYEHRNLSRWMRFRTLHNPDFKILIATASDAANRLFCNPLLKTVGTAKNVLEPVAWSILCPLWITCHSMVLDMFWSVGFPKAAGLFCKERCKSHQSYTSQIYRWYQWLVNNSAYHKMAQLIIELLELVRKSLAIYGLKDSFVFVARIKSQGILNKTIV